MTPPPGRKLTACLRAAWGNRPPKRYVPRSLDGGTGWRVWDRKVGMYLGDKAVLKVGKAAIRDEEFHDA